MRVFLFSTSTVHGSAYLEYCRDVFAQIFATGERFWFIPFARPGGLSHDEYTERAAAVFASFGKELRGLHTADNPAQALQEADGVFTGGGNTFVLLNELYRRELIGPLQARMRSGMPYAGTSAGSNIAGQTICTTNDMPIVYPPSFDALQVVPFNLNPHYLDPDPTSKHMGETRETRIGEYHVYNRTAVVGLREGGWLQCTGDTVVIKGQPRVRLFQAGKEAVEIDSGTDLLPLLR